MGFSCWDCKCRGVEDHVGTLSFQRERNFGEAQVEADGCADLPEGAGEGWKDFSAGLGGVAFLKNGVKRVDAVGRDHFGPVDCEEEVERTFITGPP